MSDQRIFLDVSHLIKENFMVHNKTNQIICIALLVFGLAGCQTWGVGVVKPGQTQADVVALLGQPSHTYSNGEQHILEYMHGRMGQVTYMATFDTKGILVSYQQVLNMETFSKIKVGEADKASVLRTIGAPSLTNFYSRTGLEAWSYPFKEDGAWNNLMAVYFDRSGVVTKLENGPDPLFDREGRGRGR